MRAAPLALAAAWLAASWLTACGSRNAVGNAAIGSGLGLTAAALARAQGGCYAVCVHGTACNRASGMCEPTACKSACAADQVCEIDAFGERCVPLGPAVVDPALAPAWDPAAPPARPLVVGDDH